MFDRYIEFVDDAMTVNQKQIMKLCQTIKDRKLDLEWSCITRVDSVTPSLLENMKEAGCTMVNYGLESGNDLTLRRINKGYTRIAMRKMLYHIHFFLSLFLDMYPITKVKIIKASNEMLFVKCAIDGRIFRYTLK